MDNWERLILYRKKLVLPRIYQLVDILYFMLFQTQFGLFFWSIQH